MKYIKTIVSVFFISGLIILPAFLVPRTIAINEVTCKSQFGHCNQIIDEKIRSVRKGKVRETKEELEEILSGSVLVRDYYIQFRLPHKLEVVLVERKPRFALKEVGSKTFALVEKGGTVIGKKDTNNLPFVETPDNLPEIGEKVGSEQLLALDIIYDLNAVYAKNSGKLENDRLVVEFTKGLTVIFPLKGDRDVLIGSLVAILFRLNEDETGFRIDDRKVNEIDLRFKNPVLR